jgi:hypothetical protein
MFIIESENMDKGGKIRWDKFYRLRHLTTNYYLGLGKSSNHNYDENVIFYTNDL